MKHRILIETRIHVLDEKDRLYSRTVGTPIIRGELTLGSCHPMGIQTGENMGPEIVKALEDIHASLKP